VVVYLYECAGDGEVIEIERAIDEPEGKYACGTCGNQLTRVYLPPAISFKGTGFYSNDKSAK